MKNKRSRSQAGTVYFYGMNMYFIALVCPEEINKPVLKWKLWMKEMYGCEAALRSPAHITIVPPFWMNPGLEDDLLLSLSKFSAGQTSFSIQLNNFSNFKPRVIFIDVISNKPLADLEDGLFRSLLSENKYPLEKDDRPFHPHVTIATRDLHKKSFYEAWDHFKEKKYEAEWTAAGLSLLRHNKKNWDVIATSQFK
jgi:2'-5' RNA ligase